MINLIPKEEKKKKVKVFYYKLIVLFLTMGGLSFFIILVAILPSYFLSSTRASAASVKLEIQKSEPVPLPQEQTILTIKDLDQKLSLIEKTESKKFIVSEKVISAIILKKMPGIRITGISYNNNSSSDSFTNKKVSIEGTAPSRNALLLFRQALENDIIFKQVDLPISNFVKGSNIQFYLSLIPS